VIVAILQARMGAKRLPGKVLKPIVGIPMLLFQINRIKKSTMINSIVVATTDRKQDDVIADFCNNHDIACFRGEENDVLARYYNCAKWCGADTIIRLTGDCPLIDYRVVDDAIRLFQEEAADFAANTVPPETSHFPDGSDVEVFSRAALERAFRECQNAQDREHVTFYFWKYENGFKNVQLMREKDSSRYRFTVDYQEDLKVVEYIAEQLKHNGTFGHLDQIIEIIESRPEIRDLNSQYHFGIGWEQ